MLRTHVYVGAALFMGYMMSADLAHAAIYYVSKTGSDTHSCVQAQSESTTKLTVSNAASCLKAGDTLYVKGGTYAESLINNVPSGTSWSNVVRIAAYPGHTVTLRPNSGDRVLEFWGTQQYIEFDGINLDGTNVRYDVVKINGISSTNNAHHIRIRNAVLRGASTSSTTSSTPQVIMTTALAVGLGAGNEFINLIIIGGSGPNDFGHGIYLNSADNLVEHCNIAQTIGNGVQIYNGHVSSAPNNNVVRYNVIRDITANTGRHRGVIVGGGTGNKIYGNLIYNIIGTDPSAGIHVYSGSNAEVYNNTVYNATVGILIHASGTTVRNNILHKNASSNYTNSGSNTVASSNLIGTDPRFVDPAAGNFRLQSTSPGLDAGLTLSLVARDLDGTLRPQGLAYDLGAYEAPLSSAVTPAAPTNVRILTN